MEYVRRENGGRYDSYRVKSPINSFRDLEVYQKTIQLSNSITNLPFLNTEEFAKDREEIKKNAESIPRLIAEAYGDKFDSRELAHKKLTESISLVTNMITKIDLFRQKFLEDRDIKDILDKLLTQYSYQKRKILNLRKAWDRVFGESKEGGNAKFFPRR
ncbi:MAG: four helix bundle protein [Nanoarchaeota archaeon]